VLVTRIVLSVALRLIAPVSDKLSREPMYFGVSKSFRDFRQGKVDVEAGPESAGKCTGGFGYIRDKHLWFTNKGRNIKSGSPFEASELSSGGTDASRHSSGLAATK
jgi:hypothetical protein